jgi:hypothetical protein
MINAPLELECIIHTEQTITFEKAEIPFSLNDCKKRKINFYVINAIAPHIEDDFNGSSIHSNGSEFLCDINCKLPTHAKKRWDGL